MKATRSRDIRKNRAARRDETVDCAVCRNKEPLLTAQDHHRTPRAFGGSDDQSNRVWLCPSCHARLHRVQEFLVQGNVSSAYGLVASLFPSDGTARGSLWEMANEAASVEREVKESFAAHKSTQRVVITLDTYVWEALKVRAKEKSVPATKYAAQLLASQVDDHG